MMRKLQAKFNSHDLVDLWGLPGGETKEQASPFLHVNPPSAGSDQATPRPDQMEQRHGASDTSFHFIQPGLG